MSLLGTADELIAALRARNGAAADLACLVSPAARIEPELLRVVRLRMLPRSDASAEADLWLSPLIASRSVLFAVMRADVAALLRERLRPQRRLWDLIRETHAEAPPAIQAEEEITWRALISPQDPEIEARLESLMAAMDEGRRGIARWAARALPRLPRSLKETTVVQRVSWQASNMLGGRPILPGASKASLDEMAGDLEQFESSITVGIRLFDDLVRVSEPPEPGSQTLIIPETTPLVLEFDWNHNRRLLTFAPRSTEVLRGVGGEQIVVTTAARERFRIEPEHGDATIQTGWTVANTTSGLTLRAYYGANAVLFAVDVADSQVKNFDFFELTGPNMSQQLRQFHTVCRARNAFGDSPQYTLAALYRGEISPSVTLTLEAPPPAPVEVGFTRAHSTPNPMVEHILEEQRGGREAPRLTAEEKNVLGGTAWTLLRTFLDQSLQDGSSLDVMLYELNEPEIVDIFQRFGRRLRIVLDDLNAHRGPAFQAMRKRLSESGCEVFRNRFGSVMRSRAIIRKDRNGAVSQVLVGSGNLTTTGLFTLLNYWMAVHIPEVAAQYEQNFEAAIGGSKALGDWKEAGGLNILFSPSKAGLIDTVRSVIRSAGSSVLYVLNEFTDPLILQELAEAARRRNIVVGGVVFRKLSAHVRWLEPEERVIGARLAKPIAMTSPIGCGRFIVADFNQPQATLLAGSSHFGSRTEQGRENTLRMHDPAVASKFAVEALDLIDQYSHRLELKEGQKRVEQGRGEWVEPYYDWRGMRTVARTVLAMTASDPAAHPEHQAPSQAGRKRSLNRRSKVRESARPRPRRK